MARNFEQFGSAKITTNRNLVVSRVDNGGFTIAQQLVVNEGGKPTKVFLKNAVFVDSYDNLKGVAEMLADVVKTIDERDNTDWDDIDIDGSDDEDVD